MSGLFLKTKLYIPPTRPGLVPRPRLIECLNEGVTRKLILISAPAGFGKTTLLSSWVQRLDLPVAWVSLDKGDNDRTSFLVYLVAALQTIDATICEAVQAMLYTPQPPPIESVLTKLINEVAALSQDFVLVLDDYQVVQDHTINDALTFLLDHMPPVMHLVIASRSDPFLPLSRLRARSQMTELRSKDLRFSTHEATCFLNRVMGLALSEDDIASLETRTEGWIAGLQLAGLSMQNRDDTAGFISAFAGDDRYIIDYLVDEVLAQRSQGIKDFLLQTSILDRMTGPLCDAVRFGSAKSPSSSGETAVAGQEDGKKVLQGLERANLFIVPLDNRRHWYRYHHLFADLLRQRLEESTPSKEIKSLHRRASLWYEENDFLVEAVEHALSAKDYERAANIMEGQANTLWERGELTHLLGWLKSLPTEQVFARPQLAIFQAWLLFGSGQTTAAKACIQAAEQVLDEQANLKGVSSFLPEFDRTQLKGRVAVIHALIALRHEDIQRTIQFSNQALECLPQQDTIWRSSATLALADAFRYKGDVVQANRALAEVVKTSKATGNIYLTMIPNLKYAVTLSQQGLWNQAIEICSQQLKIAEESNMLQTPMVGWLLAIWGEALCELNDLEGAIQQAKRGVEITEQGGSISMLGWCYQCLIRVLFAMGDLVGAEEIITKVEKRTGESDISPWLINEAACWKVRIWLAKKKLEAVTLWVQDRGLRINDEITFFRESEYIVFARILIAQAQFDDALRLLTRLLLTAEVEGRITKVIEILNLKAIALESQGNLHQALACLERALELAEPRGFIRTFIDMGEPFEHLLREAAKRGFTPAYVSKLLSAFAVQAQPAWVESPILTAEPRWASGMISAPSKSPLIEPLSERELEVLHLLKTELSGPEIARELTIALPTLRFHTRNIYGKLGVHSRMQAVTQSEELGLL